ncbi:MAG: hypothetical protein PHR21_01065 [Oscillospiraceae bacterium]|nr:hypothetical protein [Oscillospiraceae bacterium]MDD4369257.1 hypothetical protein [Oscillospiraceae bacterium]
MLNTLRFALQFEHLKALNINDVGYYRMLLGQEFLAALLWGELPILIWGTDLEPSAYELLKSRKINHSRFIGCRLLRLLTAALVSAVIADLLYGKKITEGAIYITGIPEWIFLFIVSGFAISLSFLLIMLTRRAGLSLIMYNVIMLLLLAFDQLLRTKALLFHMTDAYYLASDLPLTRFAWFALSVVMLVIGYIRYLTCKK